MAKGESLGGDLVPRSPTAKGKDPFSRKTEWDLGTRMNTMNTDSTDFATFEIQSCICNNRNIKSVPNSRIVGNS